MSRRIADASKAIRLAWEKEQQRVARPAAPAQARRHGRKSVRHGEIQRAGHGIHAQASAQSGGAAQTHAAQPPGSQYQHDGKNTAQGKPACQGDGGHGNQ